MNSDRITVSVEGGVAEVRLNRADKLNAVDVAMLEAIAAAQAELRRTPGLRAVVLSAEGRAFSVGIDLEALGGGGVTPDSLAERTHGEANIFQNAAWGWRTVAVPVIAAVHGYAFGAGLQIILGADVRLATPDCELSIMEVRWGLVPDMAGIALLRTLVRDDVARELTYTARRVSGQEAARLGLVTRTCADPRAEAMALAREIAGRSPDAVQGAKRLFNAAADRSGPELLLAEAVEQGAMMRSPNTLEALMAGRQKRDPVFRDPSPEGEAA